MRDAARAILIAIALLLISAPSAWGSTAFAYALATVLMLGLTVVLVVWWESLDWLTIDASRAAVPPGRQRQQRTLAFVIALTAASLLFSTASEWLRQILIFPNDAQRADMLVVVQEGIRRLLQGRNPYTIYHVPWEVTLPYGPLLWAPYMAPLALHADVRFVSLAGELFVPVLLAAVAVGGALRYRFQIPYIWLALLAAFSVSKDLRDFTPIAHTPSYWPLIVAFAWTVNRERWTLSALLAGLLIVARTTMVAVAPILLIAVWHRDRPRFMRTLVVLGAATVLPYLPFAIWDWRALWYALYGSYQSLMKGFVWTSTTWARDSVGITGLLLRMHGERVVEAAQVAVMLIVCAAAWRALARGRRPLPWMGLALLAFCMTTLWPVGYIYLDVVLLLTAGALGETAWLQQQRLVPVFAGALAATVVLVAATAYASIARDPAIDIGSADDRPFLYRGFADDERGDRTFTWVDGREATVLVPRRSRTDATIEIVCEPNLPGHDATQTMSVMLNGTVLSTVPLREGWQTVAVDAPSRAWVYGVNELKLSFANAVSPLEAGIGSDARKLAARFDRVSVRSR